MNRAPSARRVPAHRLLLGAIVALSLAAASVWALRVPLLGAPDENTHVDYAMAIWSNGAPIAASRHELRIDVHPYTRFFERVGAIDRTRFDAAGRVPPGYGTRAYFAAADRAAPAVPAGWWPRAYGTPYIAGSYPFGFYSVVAAVFGVAFAIGRSPIAALFAMRFFDVALFGLALVAAYGCLRESRVRPALALALVAGIGWLPTMQAVFASVQPDAMAIALFQCSLYVALRVRNRGFTIRRAIALGLVFGLFAVVKVHIFAAVALAIAPLLAVRLRRERLAGRSVAARLAAIAVPPLLTSLAARPLLAHGPSDLAYSNFAGGLSLLRTDPLAYLGEAARVTADTLGKIYGVSAAGHAYYHDFSALHTPVFTGLALHAADAAIAAGTTLVLGAMALRVGSNLRRLRRLARRRGFASAGSLVAGDVVTNAYAVFLAVLIAAEIYVDEVVSFEGRYLLPAIAGAVSFAAVLAPRVLRAGRARRTASAVMAGALAVYGATATLAGFAALQHRYYEGGDVRSRTQEYAIYLLSFAPPGGAKDVRDVPRGAVVRAAGYAFDSHRTTPTTVRAVLDGRDRLRVRNGLVDREEVAEIGDEALLRGGFAFDLDTARLAAGAHAIAFSADEPGGVLPGTRPPFIFRVVGRAETK